MENHSVSPPSPDQAFPMLAIAVLSITSSALFLFVYYFFFNRCWHQWFTLRRNRRQTEESFIALSPAMWMNRGLDESLIREIPMFQYTKEANKERNIDNECIVCLNEFRNMDMVRVLPSCSHSFHLDCIDIWLQSNPNCPLCRTSISGSSKYPLDQIVAPSSSPQGPQSQPYSGSLMGGDEDFVVIELGSGVEQQEEALLPREQRENRSEIVKCQSPGAKLDQKKPKRSKQRTRSHFSIMGDECIDTRAKDNQFSIQPIRRSFSLDSAVDQQLYLSVQAIIQQHSNNRKEESSQRSFLFKYQLM